MTTKFCPLHDMCTVTYLHYKNLQCIQCFWSRSRNSQNLWTALFSQGQNLWKTLWNGSFPGSCMHLTISPPPPKKIQCWSLISAPALASEQHWSIHLLSEGRGHRRISVLWVRKKNIFCSRLYSHICNFKNNHWGNFQLKGMIKWNNRHLQLSYETRQNKLHPDWRWSS